MEAPRETSPVASGTHACPGVVLSGPDVRPGLSIVVPVYNRLEQLSDLLEALAAQTGLRAPAEVVLSDDGSHEDVQALARNYAPRLPRLVYVRGPNSGPAVARNRGAEAASGPVLAFTDSDCLPQPVWATAIYDTVTRMGGVAYGPIRAPFPAVPPFIDALDMDDQFHRPTSAANLGMESVVFRSLGGFSKTISRIAEDHDLVNRAAAAGLRFHYATTAVVIHQARPGRVRLGLPVSAEERRFHEQLAAFTRASDAHRYEMVRSNWELLARVTAKALLIIPPALVLPSWAKATGFIVLAGLALSKWLRANSSLARAGYTWRVPLSAGLHYALLIPFVDLGRVIARVRFGYMHLRVSGPSERPTASH